MVRYQVDMYKDGATLISELGSNSLIARLETDFVLRKDTETPLKIPIKDEDDLLGFIKTFNQPESIEVFSKKDSLIGYFDGKTYRVKDEIKNFSSFDYIDLTGMEIPDKLLNMNLSQVYLLENASVLCFEKEGELASLIDTAGNSVNKVIELFPLVIAQRVFDQQFIKSAYNYGGTNGT